MVGSFSDRCTANDFSAVFSHILQSNFAWHSQYLVLLEGDSCCSAQCY